MSKAVASGSLTGWPTRPPGLPGDGDGRTAASASNSQEIDLCVALPEGIYLYEAVPHRLAPVVAGDLRAKAAKSRLQRTLKGLALRPQEGAASPAPVWDKKYVFPPNDHKLESLTLVPGGKDDAATLVVRADDAEQRIV